MWCISEENIQLHKDRVIWIGRKMIDLGVVNSPRKSGKNKTPIII